MNWLEAMRRRAAARASTAGIVGFDCDRFMNAAAGLHSSLSVHDKTQGDTTMIRFSLVLFALSLGLAGCATQPPTAAQKPAGNPQVVLETSQGNITLELMPKAAPVSVANFLEYMKTGAYDGTIFHRVIPGFMIQGGGFDPDMQKRPTHAPITNEANNGLRNLRGTLAMARTGDPQSATSQFFINTADNDALNFWGENNAGWGYAVFGKVVSGMDVVDAIVSTPRGRRDGYGDVPLTPIVINKVRLLP
jgi:cyclophilin family peptidyl-prolyl cis-trans isomerase